MICHYVVCSLFTAYASSVDNISFWEDRGLVYSRKFGFAPSRRHAVCTQFPTYFEKRRKCSYVDPLQSLPMVPICGNYRPFSLRSPFGNLFESSILARIKRTVKKRIIMQHCQFDLRSLHDPCKALLVKASIECTELKPTP